MRRRSILKWIVLTAHLPDGRLHAFHDSCIDETAAAAIQQNQSDRLRARFKLSTKMASRPVSAR